MARKRRRSRKHHLFFAVGLVLVAAAVGPLVYCVGWEEGATVGRCIEAHPLQFPTTIFVAGLLSLVTGMMTKIHLGVEQKARARDKERLDRAVEAAKMRTDVRTPVMNEKAMRGGGEEVPEAIEVDDSLEFGAADDEDAHAEEERRDSVMAFMQQAQQMQKLEREEGKKEASSSVEGAFYVPPGMANSPVLYLDASVEATPVDDPEQRVDNPNLPHGDIDEALRHAFQLVLDRGRPAMVRAMPGVYQASIEIPDRVCLINHRLPGQTSVQQRLRWLRSQVEIDHPDRVTLLTPADSEFGVRFRPGQKQGLFGCWVVGRSGVVQTGLRVRDSVATAVVNCAFESFSNSGAKVLNSGEELKGRAVQFVGCLWQRNRAPREGGALRVEDSVVRVEGSIFDSNRAPRGGAISAVETPKPLVVARSILHRNRALAGGEAPSADEVELDQWRRCEGVGGAMRVQGGLVRVVDTNFDGNDAALGGGAIASVGGRVVVKSTKGRGQFGGNRADVGGAVFCAGWSGTPAMVRMKGVKVTKNLAKSVGGGAAVIGTGVLHLEDAEVETNRAGGDERGFGGGVAAFCGGTAQISGGGVSSNQAAGGGGGVAAVNGSLRITDQCFVTDNSAGKGGGGVLAITAVDRMLEGAMGQKGFSFPLKIKIEDVRITSNRAAGLGGGVRAGNRSSGATFPVAVVVKRPERIRGNEATSDRRNSQNLWIEWCGELKVNDDVRKAVELALK